MEKKKGLKNIIIIAAVIVLVGIGGFVTYKMLNGGQEKKLEEKLIEMGSKFYSEFYYKQISNGKENAQVSEFLVMYKSTGIKINLDNLERYNNGEFKDMIKEFKNKKNNKDCDKTGTMAVIYPKEPYGEKDYKAEAILDCGFNKK